MTNNNTNFIIICMADGIVKINYHGFWQNFDKENNLLINALRKNFDVEISDKPDFLFCSWFTDEPCKDEECIKIFYSYENRTMNMLLNGFHYAIGLKKVKFSNKNNRYLRHRQIHHHLCSLQHRLGC